MRGTHWVIFAGLLVLLLSPWVVRRALVNGEQAGAGGGGGARTGDVPKLIIVTPHVEQIRDEFGAGFKAWHQRRFGAAVEIDWRTPGGTSEILRIFQSQYAAALGRGLEAARRRDARVLLRADLKPAEFIEPGAVAVDLMFGGGSFDHGRLKDPRQVELFAPVLLTPALARARLTFAPGTLRAPMAETFDTLAAEAEIDGVRFPARLRPATLTGGPAVLREAVAGNAKDAVTVEAEVELSSLERRLQVTMSAPAGFAAEQLLAWYGPDNAIGSERLYDPDQHWLGTALSGFGIVYNRPRLAALGLAEPTSFRELADYRYRGELSLADPRQSGSVATLFDSILNQEDWDAGWRLLREMCANARSFPPSSTQPPMDVSQGEAAAGVVIDFYGRGQAQAVLAPGEDPARGRVGYVDPPGAVYVDADPISLMRGSREEALARRFIEFVLSEEGQALWQFPPRGTPGSEDNPSVEEAGVEGGGGGGGVTRVTLGPRRHALRRLPVRPVMYERYLAHFADPVNPFAIASTVKRRGWRDALGVMMGAFAIDSSRELRAAWTALNEARGNTAFPPERLAEMERLFYAMPEHVMRDEEGRPRVRDGRPETLAFTSENFRAISDNTRRWRDPRRGPLARIDYTEFFRANYRRVVELSRIGDGG